MFTDTNLERIKNNIEAIKKDQILPPIPIAMDVPSETKLVILIDIVGFSKGTTRQQVYKIYGFQHYVLKKVLSNRINFESRIKIDQFIPTGDGCYIVADECDSQIALDFLVTLVSGFQYLQKDGEDPWALRASAIFGECVPFLDLAHHKNYIGEGMNEAARILSYGQSALEKKFLADNPEAETLAAKMYSRNSLYVGDTLSKPLAEYANDGNNLYEFVQVPDKHGKCRNITVLQGLK